jgi:hypothetical protein
MPDNAEPAWGAGIAGAVVAGAAAALGTILADGLPVVAAVGVTLLSSVAGFAGGQLFMRDEHRPVNGILAVVLLLGAAGLYAISLPRCAPEGVTCLVGGCDPFSVHAQNRFDPFGAALRVAPYREAAQVGGYDPNQLVPVDGWVRTRAPYPTNPAPFNSDVWFHVADDKGWVSFAGVRADPTEPALTGFEVDGSRPAPTPPECSGTIR